jgi:hypothetical protein
MPAEQTRPTLRRELETPPRRAEFSGLVLAQVTRSL